MRILIQNGEVVTASDQFKAEVLIEGEKVVAVGQSLGVTNADKTYDATGHYVIPGGVDVHCHLDMPFMGTVSKDDFFTGTRAAISGGTTSIIEFCIPSKGGTIKQALADWDAKSAPNACCDFSFHMAIVDWNEGILKELDSVFERGITSFKVFTAYKGALMLSDEEIFRLMLEVKARGGLINAHAVNGDVLNVLASKFAAEGKLTPHYHPLCQPGYAEGEATGRILELGNLAGCPSYIVHMTAKEAVEELVRARARGWDSYGEVCTQHLTLDTSLHDLPNFEGAKYVMSPPLREQADRDALWAALANGTIQVVGTDHCTFDFKGGKDMGKDDFRKIPNGLNGLEERMNMLFSYGVKSGKIPMTKFVEVTATNPAKIFGLYPRKGHLSPGADADVVIYNPNQEGVISAKTHNSACDYNVYEGWKILGAPHTVFVRGQVAYENGKFCGERGNGKFLARQSGKLQLAGV